MDWVTVTGDRRVTVGLSKGSCTHREGTSTGRGIRVVVHLSGTEENGFTSEFWVLAPAREAQHSELFSKWDCFLSQAFVPGDFFFLKVLGCEHIRSSWVH